MTYKELRTILDYNEDTGIFRWKVQLSSRGLIGSIAGNKNTYIDIRINKIKYKAHRLAWLYVFGEWPEYEIDHIDRNKHNNAINNLRDITTAQNQQNVVRRGYTKYNRKNSEKFKAQIHVDGKTIHLGIFNSETEAKDAYLSGKLKYHKYYMENWQSGRLQ